MFPLCAPSHDLVSADTLTLLVVMSYLEAQSVHFPQKNITKDCSGGGMLPEPPIALLGYQLTAPLLQNNLGETLLLVFIKLLKAKSI